MEALAEGATEEALTLATTFLGRRGTVGSSSGDRASIPSLILAFQS
jgi:hypothetical protein